MIPKFAPRIGRSGDCGQNHQPPTDPLPEGEREDSSLVGRGWPLRGWVRGFRGSAIPSRVPTALLTALAVLAFAFAGARQGQGQATDQDEELLAKTPYDILTLIDDKEFEIEPISPRPLPPPSKKRGGSSSVVGDTLTQRAQEAAEKVEDSPDELVIHLLEGDVRDYKVKRGHIKGVRYWEDMLLDEGQRLVLARNYAKAFEYYLAVQARNPNWRGLQDHVDRLLFEEGSWAISGQDRSRGLRLLRELYQRKPDYPDLDVRLADAFAGEIKDALREGKYAHGRRNLHELEQINPESPLIAELQGQFQARARDLADQGTRAELDADRLDRLTDSLRVWPDQSETPDRFAEAFEKLPTLDVGVIDVPRPVNPWINSPAAERLSPLLYRPIFVDESDDALLGNRPRQLAAMLEMGDLGRRLEVRLKPGFRWSDGSRDVSVLDAVRALADRAQPRSPAYNARWADLLDRIEASDVDTLTIRLTRTPLSPPWWLIFPVGPAHAAWDGRVATQEGRLPVGDGPYRFLEGSNNSVRLLAVEPLEDSVAASVGGSSVEEIPPPRILRIQEVRLANATDAMNALDLGEVSMLELVPHDRVSALQANDQYQVGRYRLPSLHRIAVDGRNPVLKHRLLRRGMAYAIDRKAILEEVILRRPIDEANCPSDGPFAVESAANAAGVEPIEYNPMLAAMLVAGAKRELGVNRLKFTLEYPARPDAQAAVPRIAQALERVGLEIELVERSETELEQSLRSGRRFDLAYRASRCQEPIYEVGPLLCPGYDAPPDNQGLAALASPRILQLLLQLEHAPDFETAQSLVSQIDRECRDELPILPLWQLQDYFVYRTRLKGPAETADHLYQDIERWEIEPWFAHDPW